MGQKINSSQKSNPYKFRARRTSAQSLGASTFVKINFNTEDYDTNNNYDNATNYRYTVPVTGYYQINARISVGSNLQVLLALYLNGSIYQRGSHALGNGQYGANYSDLVKLTAGDYIEIYGFSSNSGALETGTGSQAYFGAYLVVAGA